ncbi:peptide chain release factor N(5)-glutamine methyltransferase [Hirschia litorea]|uniref:Release factor glutamine methyltransferase n=1 Tax=Hirschia litorea TaxID=1199156 RepID=A0ABW2IK51_9PROT
MNKEMPTYSEALRAAAIELSAKDIEGPLRDARRLMEVAAGISATDLIAEENNALSAAILKRFDEFIARRCKGEPVSRIAGRREFWGLEFQVTRDVLDPRADTETLVELVLDTWCPDAVDVLDMGTGSGCVLLSILHERCNARGVGLDQSESALNIAALNAENLGLHSRSQFLKSNWFDALEDGAAFDVIVSNPPYIPSADIEHLDRDVRNYDPMAALDGGADGLDDYRAIIGAARSYLRPNGLIAFEVGFDQAEKVMDLLTKANFIDVKVRLDLSGVKRCVYARVSNV